MTSQQIIAGIATAYGLVSALGVLGQTRAMLRSKSSANVSQTTMSLLCGGYIIWLVYGISISSIPLILTDAVGMLTTGLTCILIWRFRPSEQQQG